MDIRYALGAISNESNDGQACLEHNIIFLRIAKELYIEGDADSEMILARAHNQIGTAWTMARDYKQAEENFRNSIRSYERLPHNGDIAEHLAIPKANLGLVLWIRGDNARALVTLEGALRELQAFHNGIACMDGIGDYDTTSFRTGRLLHALGNVYESEEDFEAAQRYHRKALWQYTNSIGPSHHRTADVCHRVARHCIRDRQFNEAAELIRQALTAWGLSPDRYANEVARTTFLQARLMREQNNETEYLRLKFEAIRLLRQIWERWSPLGEVNQILSSRELGEGEETENDFDSLVTFWSR